MREPIILCVDDEDIVLESLEIELSERFGDEFMIEIAQNADEAMEIIHEMLEEGRDITIVISDYIMPNVKGDELLKRVHQITPRTIKIMLTGQASMEGVTNAINEASLYRYIAKPWQKEDLALTIAEANRTFFQDKLLEEQNRKLSEQNTQLQELNDNLEQKVKERTQEIARQNLELKKKNNNITASIRYAKRIQTTMMPDFAQIEADYVETFTFFKPRDIVSGDFYWYSQNVGEDRLLITAVDCTGHGVPGAFMSFIGMEQLTEITNVMQVREADQILNHLHQGVIEILKKGDNEENSVRDGMDMALCIIDKQQKTMEFAGAKNSLIYVQNGELNRIQGDKLPIGGKYLNQTTFTKHVIDISKPTMCYLFTDGYQDQFGGPYGKKFMKSKFRELLFSIHHYPIEKQRQFLSDTLRNWMSFPVKYGETHRQIDDILVIGFKIDLS